MSASTPDVLLTTPVPLPTGRRRRRFESAWMVGVLFLFSMSATFVFITTTAPARLPVGIAALVAPLVSHRVLTRQR